MSAAPVRYHVLLGGAMGRWKGEQRGVLAKRGTAYYGRWREFVEDPDGAISWKQVNRKLCNVSDGKAEAIRILNENVAAAGGPAACHQGIATLTQFVDARFRPDHIEHLKPNGQRHYDYCLGHILKALGGYRLREFTPAMIQAFLTAAGKGRSGQTVVHLRNALSAIFGHAKRCSFIRGDLPTEFVKVPEIRAKSPEALSLEQSRLLLENMREPYRTVAHLMVATGLRIGEALALQWDNVDLERRVLRVRLNFSNGEWTTVKSAHSVRDLPLTDETAMALEAMQIPGPSAWLVFPNKFGCPLDAHNLSARELKPACKAAGIPPIGWHALRHTALTLIQQSGASRGEAKMVAGHGSERMTNTYTHGSMQRLRDVLGEIKFVEEKKGRLM